MVTLAEYVDGLPNLCGQEPLISEAIEAGRRRPVLTNGLNFECAARMFTVALHMHQMTTVPGTAGACAGCGGRRRAPDRVPEAGERGVLLAAG